MYSKQQVIEFANYCISNIDSDKSQETIFNEWEKNYCDKIRKHFLFYLSKLKSPYAEQAIENYDAEFTKHIDINLVNDVEEAVRWAFRWFNSPQGSIHWATIYHNIDEYLK